MYSKRTTSIKKEVAFIAKHILKIGDRDGNRKVLKIENSHDNNFFFLNKRLIA